MTIRDLLSSIDIFSDLDNMDLQRLVGSLRTRHVVRGTVLVGKGDPVDAFFIVVSGLFEVQFKEGIRSGIEIGRGQPIGEIGFFAEMPRTAFVCAKRDSTVLEFSRAEFDAITEEFPVIKDRLIRLLSQRVNRTSERLGRHIPFVKPNILAIVEIGDVAIPPTFAEQLGSALSAFGSVRMVEADAADAKFGKGRTGLSENISLWIERMSAETDILILLAGKESPDYGKVFVDHADEVLLVACAAGDPHVTPEEVQTIATHDRQRMRMVLLHENQSRYYENTNRWLELREVAHHHHVAIGNRSDHDRLARFLVGKATGLVACGGGAYCAAHIGVYKAFYERGVAFDMYGGASGGGAMAAAFAMQLEPDDLDDRTHDIFINRGALRHVTLPRYSLVDHTHFDQALRAHFQELLIEDLAVPFFAVATDFYSGREVILRTGYLWQAVRATGSIPGVLPPFHTEEGNVLVDGSLVNNLPLSAMRKLKTGPNIAIDFDLPPAGISPIQYSTIPGRWQLLRSYLLPFVGRRPSAPSLGNVIVRAMTMSRERTSELGDCDRLISPPLPPEMKVLDWSRHSELMTTAYLHAKARIEEELAAGDPVYREVVGA